MLTLDIHARFVIAAVITSAYKAIALGVFFASERNQTMDRELYQAAKVDELSLPD